jgi:hypothetical protein
LDAGDADSVILDVTDTSHRLSGERLTFLFCLSACALGALILAHLCELGGGAAVDFEEANATKGISIKLFCPLMTSQLHALFRSFSSISSFSTEPQASVMEEFGEAGTSGSCVLEEIL